MNKAEKVGRPGEEVSKKDVKRNYEQERTNKEKEKSLERKEEWWEGGKIKKRQEMKGRGENFHL